ncbi:pyridoxamine 5'-phosphate oxidase [Nitzschia inconspicua]|uniref:Pyridoxamine 5'-phosphate oxidase n=1 Tax=Nitzschia inconspicua TaxID=303405 RepID=A0A9K3M2G2_9STRA|nr:pyridoxamine 5'-phosphate oxidase [Nitzschia inconspicua]
MIASREGCYHPDDHHCECEEGLTQSICEYGHGFEDEATRTETGNVWTSECNCDDSNDSVSGVDEAATESNASDNNVPKSARDGGGTRAGGFTPTTPDQDASIARWVLQEAKWATLTTLSGSPLEPNRDDGSSSLLSANILPFAADHDTGRLFFYLLGDQHHHEATLTVSQASLNPSLFSIAGCGVDANSVVDAQDPRCAKISVSGSLHPCSASHSVPEDCQTTGIQALFQSHPSMKDWPDDHNFVVHELIPFDDGFWMLANFGGGSAISRELYGSVEAAPHSIEGGSAVYVPPLSPHEKNNGSPSDMPFWGNHAARARWVVHNSMWTTVSTIHHRNDVQEETNVASEVSFGNIRSVTDLGGLHMSSSNGLPVFYVPDVDPTAVDMNAHQMEVALTFTEAAIANRVTDTGLICAGQDVGMPTCAQVTLYGTAKVLEAESSSYNAALSHFSKTHPLAPWLSQGGSHMGGHYYTIELSRVAILDYFGGVVDVPVKEYLTVTFEDQSQIGERNNTLVSLLTLFLCLAVGFICGYWSHKYILAHKTSPSYTNIGLRANTKDKTNYSECDVDSFEEEDEAPSFS